MTEPADDRQLARIQAGAVPPELRHPDAIPGQVLDDGLDRIPFLGRDFRMAENIGLMPLLKFSDAAEIRVDDPRALSAMYALLRDCIYPGKPACGECAACDPEPCGECEGCTEPPGGEVHCYLADRVDETQCADYDAGDWSAFERHAMDTRADADQLFDFLNIALEKITGRPTKPPARSSNGQRRSSGGSKGTSSGRRGRGSKR